MPKKTWVNIGGTWRAVKNVWVNIGGAWKQKVIPKGNIAGVWKDFIQYMLTIYDNGIQFFTISKSSSGGSVIFNATNIYVSEYNTEVVAATDNMIDITGFKTLNIQWKLSTSVEGGTLFYIGASTSRTGTVYNAYSWLKNSSTTAITTSVDISSLSGSYYIKVAIHDNVSTSGSAYIYKIWLE